jgi:hypothetical protein
MPYPMGMYREGPFLKPSFTLCPGSRSELGIVRHRSPQSFLRKALAHVATCANLSLAQSRVRTMHYPRSRARV